jgi:ferredoxin-nitrite reductase
MNKVEAWKAEKHPFDVWEDLVAHARAETAMATIAEADLERMKWHGVFYRKRDEDGHYMIRVRIPGCELDAAQARVLAAIARGGYDILDVTTRGNVQVQGLRIDQLPDVLGRLEDVGLTAKQTGHDNIRNVMAHPWAGIDPEELIDVRELCRRLTAVFLGDRELSDLPRKLNVAVDGRLAPAPHCWTQDISLVAGHAGEGSVAFHWLLAGTQGQNPRIAWKLPVWVREDQAPDVLRETIRVFRAEGSREKRDKARLRYLIERIGPDGFLERVEDRLGYRLDRNEDSHVPNRPDHEDFLGWFPQKQEGLWALGVSTPLGRLTAEQMEGLAELAESCGDGTLRTAYDQGIVVPNIAHDRRRAAVRLLNRSGLEHEADSIARNIMACTGRQFCNIAVSETKGHAFGLIDRLRAKGVRLAGIRIHMSGCPSSCAQTYLGDIGLKGVRVRRTGGTRDGFDVFLGGGVHETVELGIPYRKGVDVDQLPELIEHLVSTYDNEAVPGASFSTFWRQRLQEWHGATPLAEDEYRPDVWLCEGCGHRHTGEDPPVYCPRCAALRRSFARLEDGVESDPEPAVVAPPPRSDGFQDVAALADLERAGRLSVQFDAHELVLFQVDGQVRCLDGLCPHEGGPMAQGDLAGGSIVCPWHGWAFRADNGEASDGNGCRLKAYPVKVEDGRVLVLWSATPATAATRQDDPEFSLRVIEVVQETHDTRTVRLDNTDGRVKTHRAGQHVKICVSGPEGPAWRSFTISSAPTRPEVIEVTVKRNPEGVVSPAIHTLQSGDMLTIRGPSGRFVYDPDSHREPLVFAVAGSGITPAMSILRTMRDRGLVDRPATLLYGCRTEADIIFARELDELRRVLPMVRQVITLSRPGPFWMDAVGRVGPELIERHVPDPAAARFFMCGPGDLRESLTGWLTERGVPAERIHFEVFGKAKRPVAHPVL